MHTHASSTLVGSPPSMYYMLMVTFIAR